MPHALPRPGSGPLAILLVLIICLGTGACASLPRIGGGTQAPAPMIAAAHPLASAAGLEMLTAGGSAADAALAALFVLTLVEPQSAGIGGGAFLLHYDPMTEEVTSYDGRETAPAAIGPTLFQDDAGAALPFREARIGGRSVGVPGVLALADKVHSAHGVLPWERLLEPARRLAREGFGVTPRLNEAIARSGATGESRALHATYFTPGGEPLPVGYRLTSPGYAETLDRLATEGARAFYEGAIADAIVEAVRTGPAPGTLAHADLAAYEARERPPVCAPYRGMRICGMGLPSSGGVTVIQILKLLERFDLAALSPLSPTAVHLISEASRLAYADRAAWLGDPAAVPIDPAALLDPAYVARRSALIDPARAMGTAEPGRPGGRTPPGAGQDHSRPSTTHLSVVDAAGRAVSLTASVEAPFGSHLMAGGFVLNNQLTDFAFGPFPPGPPPPNAPGPGKRPLSSMSPTLVFDVGGAFRLAIGSPGGTRIIGYVAQSLIAVLDFGLDPQAAIDLPRHVNRNGVTELEAGTALEALVPTLEALGHEVRLVPLTSGLHAIAAGPDGLLGGADPRREGVVLSGR